MSKPMTKGEVVESVLNGVQRVQNLDKDDLPIGQESPQYEVTKSRLPVIRKIKPERTLRLKSNVKITEEMKKEREYGWEYVEGIFENRVAIGETINFWINPFPGDEYAEWKVPAGVHIAVPRWLAKHLNTRKYIEFKYIDREAATLKTDDFMETFMPACLHNRTTFMKVNEY